MELGNACPMKVYRSFSMVTDVKIYPRISRVKKAIILYPSSLQFQNFIIRVYRNVYGVNITGATLGKSFDCIKVFSEM